MTGRDESANGAIERLVQFLTSHSAFISDFLNVCAFESQTRDTYPNRLNFVCSSAAPLGAHKKKRVSELSKKIEDVYKKFQGV